MNIPAFPRPLSKLTNEEIEYAQEGMSLRDYFAAAALKCPAVIERQGENEREHSEMTESRRAVARSNYLLAVAKRAYELADAMIAHRVGGGAVDR